MRECDAAPTLTVIGEQIEIACDACGMLDYVPVSK